MMKILLNILIILVIMAPLAAIAQQAQVFEDYTVHYNALNTSLITPEIAKAYGIRRSGSRALINISVLKKTGHQSTAAGKAVVTASGRNLTGQTRNIEMREINDGDGAIYYIGELSVRNMETFDFTVLVTPTGQHKPFSIKFRKQFYTE
jgi:hypothetical protein